jgi:succinate dehydrogenase / fumarate reductase flavoprotein subunit
MTYTPEMLENIKQVEATRSQRLHQTFPAMSLDERTQLLNTFHPDYITESMREVRLGVDKGSRMPNELADVGRDAHTSVLILIYRNRSSRRMCLYRGRRSWPSAALLAEEAGAKVTVVTKLRFGDANTMMAQGGIQAADRPNDSPPSIIWM